MGVKKGGGVIEILGCGELSWWNNVKKEAILLRN